LAALSRDLQRHQHGLRHLLLDGVAVIGILEVGHDEILRLAAVTPAWPYLERPAGCWLDVPFLELRPQVIDDRLRLFVDLVQLVVEPGWEIVVAEEIAVELPV